MNFLLGFASPLSGSSSSSSVSASEAPKRIGVKDISIISVVKKSLKSTNCECQLSFSDGIKVTCDLTLAEIGDLFKHRAFKGSLNGISLEHVCFNEGYMTDPGFMHPNSSYCQDLDDKWVADLYYAAKKNSNENKEQSKEDQEQVKS